ncbi:uncharacterized protein DSM5745_04411 [Aspergillus mulundensis]|uniref:Uncharacterized protein n=1 Tax=Aspergillus mulundensis TaxID=1810919 RepID=A0A3D8SCM3_9EURO|nr:hypothetical protein DSM5745_04411 [Aspergillus mulundensis]RDW84085.1 hypothetical protein DSM5745_04411 [Aspergillus mulundensis]
MLLRALLPPRTLTPLSSPQPLSVLGKPLLFPVTFSHTRLSPIKDKFANTFLLLGVPVGLHARIGNVLAIDDASLTPLVSPPPTNQSFSWQKVLAHASCWFSIDAVRMLHRGDYGFGLRAKLDSFLREQDEDPSQWPHAYLLTVPKFLSFSRNVVSWWYLYNRQRELDALILEINNSYNEKRNVFLRLTPTPDKAKAEPSSEPVRQRCEQNEIEEEATYLDSDNLITSLPTASKAKFYTGTWRKRIFASPFEKVDGLVSQRMMDPLRPESWNPTASFSNMTTLDEDGKQVRMATRLTCTQPPLDPTDMSRWELACFLVKWSVPGLFTTLEIILKALRIKFSGKMTMHSKPPVRSGSVGRYISELELTLEPFFASYLTHLITNHSTPISVTYLACRSYTAEKHTLLSPTARKSPNTIPIRSLTIEPTDPAFYSRITTYPDIKSGLIAETKMTGHTADPAARPLLVSDLDLLLEIVESSLSISPPQSDTGDKGEVFGFGPLMAQWILRLSRCSRSRSRSFMDAFVLSSTANTNTNRCLDPNSRGQYISTILRHSAARRVAFSSQRLLGIYTLICACLLRWTLLHGLFSISRSCIPPLPLSLLRLHFPGTQMSPAWAPWTLVIPVYFALLGLGSGLVRFVLRSL